MRLLMMILAAAFGTTSFAFAAPKVFPSPLPDLSDSAILSSKDLPDILSVLQKMYEDTGVALVAESKEYDRLVALKHYDQITKAGFGDETCNCGPNVIRNVGCSMDYLKAAKIANDAQTEADPLSSKGYLRFKSGVKSLAICQSVRDEWQKMRDKVEAEIAAAKKAKTDYADAKHDPKGDVPQSCIDAMKHCGPFRLEMNIAILHGNIQIRADQLKPLSKLMTLMAEVNGWPKVGEHTTLDAATLKKKRLEIKAQQNFLNALGDPAAVIPAN